jgi:nitrite reductase/ring-hydroxylating ferredoxin subunit
MKIAGASPEFAPVAPTQVLTSDGIHPCQVGSKRVLVCRHAGQWYAVEALCTHAGASLEGGRLSGGKIYCPFHGAAFDLATGAPLSPPAFRPLATYQLRIVDDVIEIAI